MNNKIGNCVVVFFRSFKFDRPKGASAAEATGCFAFIINEVKIV